MNFDFALILVLLTAVSGAIWAVDRWLFAPGRRRRAADGKGKEPVLVEYARSFFPVFLIVLLIRSFLAEPFRIPSSSMMPTLLIGDFILVNKFTYGIRLPVLNSKVISLGEPQRGDVIVFRYPENPKEDYIKRVIGVPGDEVVYRNKVLYVNGVEVPQSPLERYIGKGSGRDMTGAELRSESVADGEYRILIRPQPGFGPLRDGRWQVGEGQYFVLGDNRDNSQDSRVWGMVPEANLVGKAFLIWWNWDIQHGGMDFGRIGTLIK
ncbi:MAG TPA: signal peptidase I [Xanthomonadaceae bacterium]|nr:signal peptidase I [Xanthomonadaceae bacterium]